MDIARDDEKLDGASTEDGGAEALYFVSYFDPTGVLLTAHKSAEHLTLAQAKALQAEASAHGAMLLIYRETPSTPA